MATKAKGVSKLVAYKKETTFGVPAGATGGKLLRRTSADFTSTRESYESSEIRTDRQVADFRLGVKSTDGSLSGEGIRGRKDHTSGRSKEWELFTSNNTWHSETLFEGLTETAALLKENEIINNTVGLLNIQLNSFELDLHGLEDTFYYDNTSPSCLRWKVWNNQKNKSKIRKWQRKHYLKNKDYYVKYARNWARENKDHLAALRQTPENKKKIAKRAHQYYINHQKGTRKFIEQKKISRLRYKKRNPVTFLLVKRMSLIKQRCINPNYRGYKYYGGKGIKFFLTLRDMKLMWSRDKAHLMEKPSVDRINPDGHYELSNCRFLENHLNRPRKKIPKE